MSWAFASSFACLCQDFSISFHLFNRRLLHWILNHISFSYFPSSLTRLLKYLKDLNWFTLHPSRFTSPSIYSLRFQQTHHFSLLLVHTQSPSLFTQTIHQPLQFFSESAIKAVLSAYIRLLRLLPQPSIPQLHKSIENYLRVWREKVEGHQTALPYMPHYLYPSTLIFSNSDYCFTFPYKSVNTLRYSISAANSVTILHQYFLLYSVKKLLEVYKTNKKVFLLFDCSFH